MHPADPEQPYRRHLVAAISALRLPTEDCLLVVSGGRDFEDSYLLGVTLGILKMYVRINRVLHGGARGADVMAGRWAKGNLLTCSIMPAMWKKDDRAAGPIRNQAMVERALEVFPNCVVVAFPGGDGTADMVIRCRQNGLSVLDVSELLDIC